MKITLEPNQHKGWSLDWREDHENRNNWVARKGSALLFGDTPKLLLEKIDSAETVRARLKPPIKVLLRGRYDHAFAPAVIHTVCNHECYLTRADGKEETVLLCDLKPGDSTLRAIVIHDTKQNHAILKRGIALRHKAHVLTKQAEKLASTVKCVTEADILIAAKP